MTVTPPTPPARPARRFALAAATALALGAGALSIPAFAADGGAAGPPKVELKDGTLDWGVKESFRKYVTGMAKGTIETAAGAKQAADNGPFTFTGGSGTYDMGTHAVATTFKGSVRFVSKAHRFDIELADLKLSTKGTAGSITADITAEGKTEDDVELASLDLSKAERSSGDSTMTFAKIPAKLTAEGAKAFNDMYQEGQELDPATLTVKTGGGGQPTQNPTTGPTQNPTTGPTTDPTTGPTGNPTDGPSRRPTTGPTGQPTTQPTPSGKAPGDADGSGGDAAAESGPIADGNLDWGVKKSFRTYITVGAKGKIQLSGGAAKNGDGYRFPKGHGSYDADKSALDAAFDGAVRFTGHEGQLDLKFSDLKVRVKGGKGALVADVSAKARDSGKVENSKDLRLADLDLSGKPMKAKGKIVTLSGVPARLTDAGAKAFGGYYDEPAKRDLDPVTLNVSLDKNAQLPDGSGSSGSSGGSGGSSADGGLGGGAGTTGGSGGITGGSGGGSSLASTGSSAPTTALVGGAAALVLAGGAAAYATRRRTGARG
ncbi:HtaA domain-containing protein [Streptomyces sp. NPDC050610]|uniref:HtaA domain-containing protein n=1 Tax=Streptomyces sp. NPDC050610 TaxID=3157097 RepID=UPI0034150390